MELCHKQEKCVIRFQIYYCIIDKRKEDYYALVRINTKVFKVIVPMENYWYNAFLYEIPFNEVPNGFTISFCTTHDECVGNTYIKLTPQHSLTKKYPIQTQSIVGETLIYSSVYITNTTKIQSLSLFKNGILKWRKGIIPNTTIKVSKSNCIYPIFDGNQYHIIYNQLDTTLQITMNQPYYHLCYYFIHNQSLPSYTSLHIPSILLNSLGPSQLIGLFLALLINKRIILTSKCTTTVVFAVLQLLDFIVPFEYTSFCKAPCTLDEITPLSSYFIGVVSNESIIRPGVISVDLDKGIIYGPFINIPPSVTSSLLSNIGHLRVKKDSRYFIAFRWFMAQLLINAKSCLAYSWISDCPKVFFDRCSWLLSLPEDWFEFGLILSKTPMFCQYLYKNNGEFNKWISIYEGYSFDEVCSKIDSLSYSIQIGKKGISQSINWIASAFKTVNIDKVNCYLNIPPTLENKRKIPNNNNAINEVEWIYKPNTMSSKKFNETIKSQRGRISICYSLEQLAHQTWLIEQARFETLSKIVIELSDVCLKENDDETLAWIIDISDKIAIASRQKLITKLRKIPIKIEVWKLILERRLKETKKEIYEEPNQMVLNYNSIQVELKNKMKDLEILMATSILNGIISLMEFFGLKSKVLEAFTDEITKYIPFGNLIQTH
ncbi:hypothetical protein EHI8A_013430 [Entamoeba histolytica HM-1:IMSS-B]|uniref:cDENN domain-containing protein n=6 Tax=Entamoeba histolytica TaxID=5759 RepID=C4LVF4_ENTH1|nr:hypothetical protein EHI_197380 [Entamoeba histolytica HM-1:IMSS]EMD49573.1 Hypothetical protein EHI5A_005570 [Entamoeba histolytica KU27]EMH73745.1 hypothetical protein EHI8A_013430 [Entamoeba histolytica HM-1:IMSS-B]EMS17835.1 hypothetical protein KM1_041440 [Entamoeba histolytica HM-3:IMSS]ENY65448.1 hypothetical protein EHI7A_017270 [Entamoeba histolytica HM-1:IMSS-A]GAT92644.1 hypothetical protein CL6EHI_197380 [Entamoeba histolytica]|eukprot:XP_651679.1 hypothetical protein EHI_197380 [Entamoeba histolytica HM-1:IMSS]